MVYLKIQRQTLNYLLITLFFEVKNVDASNIDLNNNLKKIGTWTLQWKMNFNSDPTKQAQELIFSCKVQMINRPPFFLIKMPFRKALFKII